MFSNPPQVTELKLAGAKLFVLAFSDLAATISELEMAVQRALMHLTWVVCCWKAVRGYGGNRGPAYVYYLLLLVLPPGMVSKKDWSVAEDPARHTPGPSGHTMGGSAAHHHWQDLYTAAIVRKEDAAAGLRCMHESKAASGCAMPTINLFAGGEEDPFPVTDACSNTWIAEMREEYVRRTREK